MLNTPEQYQWIIFICTLYTEFYKQCVDTARSSLERYFDVT